MPPGAGLPSESAATREEGGELLEKEQDRARQSVAAWPFTAARPRSSLVSRISGASLSTPRPSFGGGLR
eukprot:9485486-Pyramimonas_sp.AAC.1